MRKDYEHDGHVYETLEPNCDSQSDANKPNQLIFLVKKVQEAKHLRKSDHTVDLPNSGDSCYTIETALAIHVIKRNN